jgi:hypothetical protein
MSQYEDEVIEAQERVRKFTHEQEDSERELLTREREFARIERELGESKLRVAKAKRDLSYWKDELPIRERKQRDEEDRVKREEENNRRFDRAA